MTNAESFSWVKTVNYGVYEKYGVSSNRVADRSPAFGYDTNSRTTSPEVRIIRDANGYYYYGKVAGQYTTVKTMQWTYSESNTGAYQGALCSVPSEFYTYSTDKGSNKSAFKSVYLPAYYASLECWANGLEYPEEVNYSYKLAPRNSSVQYVCDLKDEHGVCTSSGFDSDGNKLQWMNAGKSGGVCNNSFAVRCQWLNWGLTVSNLKSKKIFDSISLDWFQKDGVPLVKNAPKTTTYQLSVTVPTTGLIYFYNYTTSKITDWPTLYTTISADNKYKITGGVNKSFECDASQGDVLAFVYLPASGSGSTVTDLELTYQNDA